MVFAVRPVAVLAVEVDVVSAPVARASAVVVQSPLNVLRGVLLLVD